MSKRKTNRSIAKNMKEIGNRLFAKGHYHPDAVDYHTWADKIEAFKEFVGDIPEEMLRDKYKIDETKITVIGRLVKGESLDHILKFIPVHKASITQIKEDKRKREQLFSKEGGRYGMGSGSWDNAVRNYEK